MAAIIIKIIGDLIFHRKGGLKLLCVAESLKCSLEIL